MSGETPAMIFITNKYTKYYYSIVEQAKARTLPPETYIEKHHIIPKSLGGDNSKDNMAKLTAREHFICHWLLIKMTSSKDKADMIYALNGMKRKNKYQERYETKITSRVYARIKLLAREQTSKLAKGKAPAKNASTGEKLGKILLDDSRWESGEIVGADKRKKRYRRCKRI